MRVCTAIGVRPPASAASREIRSGGGPASLLVTARVAAPGDGRTPARRTRGFTLVEIMIAIGLLSMVIVAIYSTWTAILRASRVGLETAAAAQRARITIRVLEDSLASAQSFAQNAPYYSFVVDGGNDGSLSFVAHLSESFPRSGKFGDFNIRRLTYSVEENPEGGRQLVLRQSLPEMEIDADEKAHPLILAKNVGDFKVEMWDDKVKDWVDQWKDNYTNQIPKLIKITLSIAENAHSSRRTDEQIVRLMSPASDTVPPVLQPAPAPPVPPGAPGQPGQPGQPGLPGQPPVPGQPQVPGQFPGLIR